MTDRIFDAVIRVSRVNGRSGDTFMSPEQQHKEISQHAAMHGVTIGEVHYELDVSGGSTERKGLSAGIERCKTGVVDGLYVAKVDRFSRTVEGGLSCINQLQDCKSLLWSAREGVIVGDEKATATNKLIRGFFLLLAEWQRDTLTEGWQAVRERHIGNGIANHPKWGYLKDPATRRLVPHPSEGPWVPLIFERRAERWPWAKIADWLTAEGAPTKDGGAWSISSVKQIVTSRVYLGEIRSGDIVNESAHEPLVSLDLWQRANAVATNGGERRAAEPYLLTGLIRCASCGVRMFGLTDRRVSAQCGCGHPRAEHRDPAGTETGDRCHAPECDCAEFVGEPVTYRYYRCRGRHGSWGRCPGPARILADDVEAVVQAVFRDAFLADSVPAVPSVATDELDRANAELADAVAELEAFVTTATALDVDLFATGVAARQAKRDAARDAVANARNAITGVALPADLADEWHTLEVAEKRDFLADAIEVVAVGRGRDPVADRVRVWTRNDPSIPSGLPDVGTFSGLRAIEVPGGAGVAAGE